MSREALYSCQGKGDERKVKTGAKKSDTACFSFCSKQSIAVMELESPWEIFWSLFKFRYICKFYLYNKDFPNVLLVFYCNKTPGLKLA